MNNALLQEYDQVSH